MFEKFKKYFTTKYRIIPTYADNKQVGFVVQQKLFFCCWVTMQMPKIERIKCENDVITEQEAFFSTKEEAMDFITYQKTAL